MKYLFTLKKNFKKQKKMKTENETKILNVESKLDIFNKIAKERVKDLNELEKNANNLNREAKNLELKHKNVEKALITYKRGNIILITILILTILLTCSVIIALLISPKDNSSYK
jgi:hypothetical protein